jgi:hypothetical protein
MEPIKVTFSLLRETPGTYRYAEEGDQPVLRTLYIPKPYLRGQAPPRRITVTVEATD